MDDDVLEVELTTAYYSILPKVVNVSSLMGMEMSNSRSSFELCFIFES